MGATGTGKTYTMSQVIARVNKPTLVIAHNKTLAGQLYSEFKEFFPENAVEYFVSYYDYYQPEAYVPSSDTYIEKTVRSMMRLTNSVTQRPQLFSNGMMLSSWPPFPVSTVWDRPRNILIAWSV